MSLYLSVIHIVFKLLNFSSYKYHILRVYFTLTRFCYIHIFPFKNILQHDSGFFDISQWRIKTGTKTGERRILPRKTQWIPRIAHQNLPCSLALSIRCLHINCSLCQPAPDIVTCKRASLFGRSENRVMISNDRAVRDCSSLVLSFPLFCETPTHSYPGSDVCRFLNHSYYSVSFLAPRDRCRGIRIKIGRLDYTFDDFCRSAFLSSRG